MVMQIIPVVNHAGLAAPAVRGEGVGGGDVGGVARPRIDRRPPVAARSITNRIIRGVHTGYLLLMRLLSVIFVFFSRAPEARPARNAGITEDNGLLYRGALLQNINNLEGLGALPFEPLRNSRRRDDDFHYVAGH